MMKLSRGQGPGLYQDKDRRFFSGLASIGDTITVADLVLPKGVEVLSDPTEMLAVITHAAMRLMLASK